MKRSKIMTGIVAALIATNLLVGCGAPSKEASNKTESKDDMYQDIADNAGLDKNADDYAARHKEEDKKASKAKPDDNTSSSPIQSAGFGDKTQADNSKKIDKAIEKVSKSIKSNRQMSIARDGDTVRIKYRLDGVSESNYQAMVDNQDNELIQCQSSLIQLAQQIQAEVDVPVGISIVNSKGQAYWGKTM